MYSTWLQVNSEEKQTHSITEPLPYLTVDIKCFYDYTGGSVVLVAEKLHCSHPNKAHDFT